MKICVLIKQVASEDSSLILNYDRLSLDKDGLNLISNEPDTYALEEALQIKEKTNGEVIVCTMGEESSGQVLKELVGAGVKLGISSRGMGSVHESNGDTNVEDDFQLICVDMVSEPSTPGAFVLKEGKFVSENELSKTFNKSDRINRIFNVI